MTSEADREAAALKQQQAEDREYLQRLVKAARLVCYCTHSQELRGWRAVDNLQEVLQERPHTWLP